MHKMVDSGKDRLVLSSGLDVDELIASCPNHDAIEETRQNLGLNGNIIITMISRLIKSKGVSEYLQAAELLKKKFKNVSFLLVGPSTSEGSQAFPLEKIQRKQHVVTYTGPRKDIPAILSLSDIFVLPSFYREGVPRVLLEAGALGLPLVTTNMPGCKEVVRDGWNGYLVPIRDSKQLAAAISKLISSDKNRAIMGKRSSQYIRERFSLEKVADAYAQVYDSILA